MNELDPVGSLLIWISSLVQEFSGASPTFLRVASVDVTSPPFKTSLALACHEFLRHGLPCTFFGLLAPTV